MALVHGIKYVWAASFILTLDTVIYPMLKITKMMASDKFKEHKTC